MHAEAAHALAKGEEVLVVQADPDRRPRFVPTAVHARHVEGPLARRDQQIAGHFGGGPDLATLQAHEIGVESLEMPLDAVELTVIEEQN
jgi:hypothetical protein